MKLVIDISKKDYDYAKSLEGKTNNTCLQYKIANGVPLEEVLEDIKTEIDKERVCKIDGFNAIGTKSEKGFDMGLLRAIKIINERISRMRAIRIINGRYSENSEEKR